MRIQGNFQSSTRAVATLPLLFAGWSGVAFAQDREPQAAPARSTSVDEIVVTARRTQESLISVPVAVTALSSADVTRYAATDLTRIAQLNPQVEMMKGGAGTGAIFLIRGIGSSATDGGMEQTVAVNIDGVQVTRGRIMDLGMFDVQQVEILKGPQALFFGKNSPAGVISVTSVSPGDTLEGYVRGGYEFKADEKFIEGAISVPISDTLRVRLAGRGDWNRGWIRNTAVPRQSLDPAIITPGTNESRNPHSKEYVGRLTVVYEPSDSFKSTLKALVGKRDETDDNNFEVICVEGRVNPIVLGVADPQNDCKLNRRRASSNKNPLTTFGTSFPDGDNFSTQTNKLFSWTNELDLGNMALTAVTGLVKLKKIGRGDSSASSYGLPGGGGDEYSTNFSQELRLVSDFDGPLNFTVGAFYEHVKRRQYGEATLGFHPVDPATGLRVGAIKKARNKGETISAFGQLRWNILENLELAGGARWTHEKKSTEQLNAYINPIFNGRFSPSGKLLSSRFSDNNVSPEITLTWHPTPGQTVYGAYKTGYKSGGIANPTLVTVADTEQSLVFGPEKARGGEIGYKGRLLNGSLVVQLTAYRYTFKGLQVSSYDNQALRFILGNAASARTTGVEGSLDWRAAEGLSLRGAFGYNRAKFVDFPGAACYAGQTADLGCVGGRQDLSGKQLYRAPKFSASMGANYDMLVGKDLMAGVSVDTRYTSSYIAQENYNPLSHQGSYWLVNASARIYAEDNGWELAFIGRNLTNENYIGFSVDHPGGSPGQIAVVGSRAREFLLQGTFRF